MAQIRTSVRMRSWADLGCVSKSHTEFQHWLEQNYSSTALVIRFRQQSVTASWH